MLPESDKASIDIAYRSESRGKTLKIGRLMCFVGIPAIIAFGLQDVFLLKTSDFLVWRIIGLAALVAYLALSLSVLPKRSDLVIPAHAFAVTAAIVMTTGICLVVLLSGTFTLSYRIGVSGGLLAAIIVVFLFAGGLRPYLAPILALPFVAIAAAVLISPEIELFDVSFYTNPLIGAVGVVAISYLLDRLARREFEARSYAETQAKSLEKKVKEIGGLNEELAEALAELKREVADRRKLEDNLQNLVLIDDLTGVYNRRASFLFLERMHATADRRNESFTLCFLDVDNLKTVNDNLGHAEGDVVLKNIARALKEATRTSDEVFRIGGDEFVLVLPDCTHEGAEEILRRVRHRMLELNGDKQALYNTDISYGFAEHSPNNELDVDSLMKIADSNMYRHKIQKKERR